MKSMTSNHHLACHTIIQPGWIWIF